MLHGSPKYLPTHVHAGELGRTKRPQGGLPGDCTHTCQDPGETHSTGRWAWRQEKHKVQTGSDLETCSTDHSLFELGREWIRERGSSPQEGITPAARPQQSLPWASLSTLPVFNSSPPSCLAISISQSLTTHHLPPPFQPAPRQSSSPPGPAQRYLLRSIFACAIGQSLPLLPPPSYSARQLRKEQSQ